MRLTDEHLQKLCRWATQNDRADVIDVCDNAAFRGTYSDRKIAVEMYETHFGVKLEA